MTGERVGGTASAFNTTALINGASAVANAVLPAPGSPMTRILRRICFQTVRTVFQHIGFECKQRRRPARRAALTAPAIGRDALIRKPHAGRQFAGLPEPVARNAAARIPVAADAPPFW